MPRRPAARLLALLLLTACTLVPGRDTPSAPATQVYLVIVDGLDARLATPERMPRLADAVTRGRGSWLTARAAMPTRTNPNHATLLTGVEPEAHGITGNWWWDGRAERELDDPALLEVETLFTAIARQRPALRTLAVFAKAKLRRLFAEAPGRQAMPSVWWSPARPTDYAASDDEAMAAFRELTARERPALAVLAIADVDGVAHRDGRDAPTYAAAVAHVDALVGALVGDLVRDGRWRHAVVIVTADHGFETLVPAPAGRIDARALSSPGAVVVSDGGVAHVYRRGPRPARGPDPIAAVAARARALPDVAAVYAVPGGDAEAVAPPPPADWHASNPRNGVLLLVARPGRTFVDGPGDPTRAFRGNHGGPGDRAVPLVVAGGDPCLRRAAMLRPASADVAPTIARLLGMGPSRRVDGEAPAAASAGRALEELIVPGCGG